MYYDTKYPYIKLTESMGLGVFAREIIPKNTIITEYCGSVVSKDDLTDLPNLFKSHCATLKRNFDLIMGLYRPIAGAGIGSFVNSSTQPNAAFWRNSAVSKLFVKSLKEIKEGEEITINYEYY